MDGEAIRKVCGKVSLKAQIFAAVLLIIFVLQAFSAERVYADELHYVRDNNIDFYLPDGWDMEEITPDESSDSGFELIASSQGDGVVFDLYYHPGETTESVYFDSSSGDAERYYEEQGRGMIEALYGELYPGEQITVAEPELADLTWDTYLKLMVTVGSGAGANEQLVYFSARSSYNYSYEDETRAVVDRILLFRNDQGGTMTAEQLDEWAEPIAAEYYDFGYDDILMGDAEESSFDDTYHPDSETDSGAVLSSVISVVMSLIFVIVIMIVVLAIKRRARRARTSYPKARWQQADLSPGKKDTAKERKKSEKDRKKNGSSKRENHDRQRQPATVSNGGRRHGSGYVESLETLRKSGLVTKAEMQELLDKYERTMRDLERRKKRRS